MPKQLKALVLGPFAVNCYLLWNTASKEALIIDPGAEPETISYWIDEFDLTPKAILLTHGHGDHIAAVAELKESYKIPLYVGKGDEPLLADPSANISAFFDHPIVAPEPDHVVEDEQVVSIASIRLTVLATPGHTIGGVCYLEEKAGRLFAGDTLFAGSIGRTDLQGGDFGQLVGAIKSKIMALPDGVLVYPGHGPHTTVGTERNSNPFLISNGYG